MRAEDRVRILHMIEAGEAVTEFIAGQGRSALDDDRKLLFAVVRGIEVFGEAASKLSSDVRAAHDAIPWKAIIGMRNRLIHAYFDIDTELVWVAANEELPALLDRLRSLVPDAGQG